MTTAVSVVYTEFQLYGLLASLTFGHAGLGIAVENVIPPPQDQVRPGGFTPGGLVLNRSGERGDSRFGTLDLDRRKVLSHALFDLFDAVARHVRKHEQMTFLNGRARTA